MNKFFKKYFTWTNVAIFALGIYSVKTALGGQVLNKMLSAEDSVKGALNV